MRIATQAVARTRDDLSRVQWRIVAEKRYPTYMWHWYLDSDDARIITAGRDRGTISMVHRYDEDRTVLLCKIADVK
jgi:hypothetical protein